MIENNVVYYIVENHSCWIIFEEQKVIAIPSGKVRICNSIEKRSGSFIFDIYMITIAIYVFFLDGVCSQALIIGAVVVVVTSSEQKLRCTSMASSSRLS